MRTIFLSSTFGDLQAERSAVRDVVLRLGQQYSGMEYFGSDPERPLAYSLAMVERASAYVGVIAHRYGSVDSATGKSITQLEYEAACRFKLPIFIYIKDLASLVLIRKLG